MILLLLVEHRKVLFVLLVEVFEHFEAFVVDFIFQLKVGVKRLFCGDKLLYFVKRGNNAHSDADASGSTHGTHVLRVVNGFDDVSRDIGKHLAGEVGKRTATDKSYDVGRFDFLCRGFEHPTLVIAYTFEHGTDKFRLACL